MRALDTVGGELRVCNHAGCAAEQRSNVTLVGVLRNRGGTSAISESRAHLSGVSDAGAPQLERFEVMDPGSDTDKQVDYVFSDGDQITITFDRATDLGAVEAIRERGPLATQRRSRGHAQRTVTYTYAPCSPLMRRCG